MCDIKSKVKSSVVLYRSQFQEIVSFSIGFTDESFVINITASCNNISIFRRWFNIHYSGYYFLAVVRIYLEVFLQMNVERQFSFKTGLSNQQSDANLRTQVIQWRSIRN